GLTPDQAKRGIGCAHDPGGELDCGPVVIGTAEGNEKGAARAGPKALPPCHEHADVTGRRAENDSDLAVEESVVEKALRRIDEYEIGVLLGRKPDEVRPL